MKKTILLFLAFLPFGNLLSGQAPGFDFTRARLFSGFDGKICKIEPCIATDWRGTMIMTYTNLLLSGSDVFCGQLITKSTDGGKTWSEPEVCESLREKWQGEYRIAYNARPRYSRYHSKWYALGWNTMYLGDKAPFQKVVDGKPFKTVFYADIDIEKGQIGEMKTLPVPFKYGGVTVFGDPVELENGDIILCFYYVTPEQTSKNYKSVCVRYRFAGDALEVVQAGKPVSCDELKRGVYEPSLTCFEGKYYLTLRSDERGMYCESEDGLNFGPLKTWCWEDGTPIGNKNTQQRWVNLGDKLYLAYTRENGANAHVFRNRAPLYSCLFNAREGTLVRDTEFVLVPELGARLGNFETVNSGDGHSCLVVAEWMQPLGCEKYGSDNSIWFLQINNK